MKEINKHPAPEKLLRQVTAETINGLELGGEIDHPSIIKLPSASSQRRGNCPRRPCKAAST